MNIIDGMLISNYVTKTTVGDHEVMYGPFDTKEEAEKWLANLIGGAVEAVYVPAYNRG